VVYLFCFGIRSLLQLSICRWWLKSVTDWICATIHWTHLTSTTDTLHDWINKWKLYSERTVRTIVGLFAYIFFMCFDAGRPDTLFHLLHKAVIPTHVAILMCCHRYYTRLVSLPWLNWIFCTSLCYCTVEHLAWTAHHKCSHFFNISIFYLTPNNSCLTIAFFIYARSPMFVLVSSFIYF
jgi:hypothetical protein